MDGDRDSAATCVVTRSTHLTLWIMKKLALLISILGILAVIILYENISIVNGVSLAIPRRADASHYDSEIPVDLEDALCPRNAAFREEFMLNYDEEKAKMKDKLVELQKRWLARDLKLYVQHIHKGGGTSLCSFFSSTQIRMHRMNNCNGPVPFFQVTASNFLTLKQEMERQRLQAAFNERSMASMSTPEALQARSNFLLLTAVRHPIDRSISHMTHVFHKMNDKSNEALANRMNMFLNGSVHGPLSAEKEEFHHHENNFQAMNFLGRFHHQTTSTPISTSNALHALDQFDIIIPTDDMSTGISMLRDFLKAGGRVQAKRKNVREHSSSFSSVLRSNNKFRELLEHIIAENCIDIALYDRATSRFQMLVEIMEQHMGKNYLANES